MVIDQIPDLIRYDGTIAEEFKIVKPAVVDGLIWLCHLDLLVLKLCIQISFG